jgi:type II secretory pathway component GspD/PulD (secretin)
MADKPADQVEKSKAETKTYQFEFRNKPWSNILEWLGEQAGLPVICSSLPTGTFTFIPPRIKPKYSLVEIIDILNEELLNQKYILIRREATFTILPADEKMDPTLLPRVRLDELEKRGRTELVTVVLPLTTRNAKDLGPDVKKMLGAFGNVIILEKFNQLILQDTAGNLLRIYQAIKELEAREPEKKL